MILHGRIIMAAHGLSAGKATLIVLIIPMIFVILGVIGVIVFTGGEIVREFLLSTGYLPNAHDEDCPVYKRIWRLKPPWRSSGKAAG